MRNNYFLDGTKIEANASKYSWVWGKNTARYKENLKKKVLEHLTAINIIEEEENVEYGNRDLPEMGNGPQSTVKAYGRRGQRGQRNSGRRVWREENYEYLEEEKVEHYVKYNTFHKEKSKKWQKDGTRVQNCIM